MGTPYAGPLVDGNPQVVIDGVVWRYIPGSFAVAPAPRFGQKVSIGSLNYGDFNQFEQAWSQSRFDDGYGLRRFADLGTSIVNNLYFGPESLAQAHYAETSNVDARSGVPANSPAFTVETTGLTSPPVWQGEYTPGQGSLAGSTKYIAIGGTKIKYRNSNGTWTDSGITLPANAKIGAIGVFNGVLTIGFGSAAAAITTFDLATTQQLAIDATLQPPQPTTFGTAGTGGTLNNATSYAYRVSAVVNGLETLANAETAITTPTGANTCTVTVRWNKVVGSSQYKVYGRTAAGELLMATITNPDTTFWLDDGSVTPSGALPATNASAQSQPLYIYAFTENNANTFVAGGADTKETNVVVASADGNYYSYIGAVECGGTDSPITALAPGQGVTLLYVVKDKEFGQIAFSGIYQTIYTFKSRLSTNGLGITTYLGTTTNPNQGPNALVFPADHTMLAYTASQQNAGNMQDIGITAQIGLRPINAVGLVTAIQGTPHFLYFAIQGSDGHVWINARDSRSGSIHTFLDLGPILTAAGGVAAVLIPTLSAGGLASVNVLGGGFNYTDASAVTIAGMGSGATATVTTTAGAITAVDVTAAGSGYGQACQSIGITSLFGTNPLLMMAYGNNIASMVLPLNSDVPTDDPNCTFQTYGWLQIPDIDHGFVDEQKLANALRGVLDASAGSPKIYAYDRADGRETDPFTLVSHKPIDTSKPSIDLFYDVTDGLSYRRLTLLFVFVGSSNAAPAVFLGYSQRSFINPALYRIWTMVLDSLPGVQSTGALDADNPTSRRIALENLVTSGKFFVYQDPDQIEWTCRLVTVEDQEPEKGRQPASPIRRYLKAQILQTNPNPITANSGYTPWA